MNRDEYDNQINWFLCDMGSYFLKEYSLPLLRCHLLQMILSIFIFDSLGYYYSSSFGTRVICLYAFFLLITSSIDLLTKLQGLGLRPGVIDGAISISAVQVCQIKFSLLLYLIHSFHQNSYNLNL